MRHPLVTYWKSTFAQYNYAEGAFFLPNFPDPIMSPIFTEAGPHQNRILSKNIPPPKNATLIKSFKVGTCRLNHWPDYLGPTEIQPLHVAVVRENFWQILEQSFPKDMAYLRKLLPFLPVTNALYKTIFIKTEDGRTAGLVNLGVSDHVALVLTAAILPEFRGHKLCRQIVNIAGSTAQKLGAEWAVYWTEHDFLLKYAHQVHHYQIFLRQKRIDSAQAFGPAGETGI